MSLKKRVSKSLVIALAGIMISAPILETAYAYESMNDKAMMIQTVIQEDVDGISDCFGLTYEEKAKLIQDVVDHQTESENTRVKRGKLSISVKTMRTIWRKLPFKVRKFLVEHTGIAGVGALQTILGAVDNFTGSVENAVYKSCKKAGMNDHYAWWVTKSIMLFL